MLEVLLFLGCKKFSPFKVDTYITSTELLQRFRLEKINNLVIIEFVSESLYRQH